MSPTRRLAASIAAALAALLCGVAIAQADGLVAGIEAETAAVAAQAATIDTEIAAASRRLADVQRRQRSLDDRMQRIEQRAQVQALGHELAQALVELLQRLPRPREFEADRAQRLRLQIATSDANLDAEDDLLELADLGAAAEARMAAARPPVPVAERPQIAGAVRAALGQKREQLAALVKRQRQLLALAREVQRAEDSFLADSEAAREKLTHLLYWLPAPPGTRTVGQLGPALAWTVSPTNWRAAADTLVGEARAHPSLPLVGLLLTAGLLVARPWLLRGIARTAPQATGSRYGVDLTLAAIGLTLALALPVPLLMWVASLMLHHAADPPDFAIALGDSLQVTARLLLAISAFAWMLDRRGVSVLHFGSHADPLDYCARALRRWLLLASPLVFIAALNALNHAPWSQRESLGRLGFSLLMISSAGLVVQVFRSGSPPMRRLFATSPRSLVVGLHGAWMAALVAVPLGLMVLAGAGYFVLAEYLYGKTIVSMFLVLAAVALYGVMAVWVQQQRFRLARMRYREGVRAATSGEAGAEAVDLPPPRLDLAALGAQTRALLNLLVTLLLLAGLWSVWKDVAALVSIAGEQTLWSVTETVGDQKVVRAITAYSVLLALFVVAVTGVLLRNVGALLDFALMQRFEMQHDATYAVKVISRYCIAGAAVVLLSRILGIAWSDAQWLVAALGVGLGFGLQEIVANIVSGVIVLTERPVRVGDVITVGDITGTVSGIGARATRVIDFDNKEVLIPNKSFITERVVNWTLSDKTTRLLLKVGVAYGSDIERVQRLLVEAARANADVMATPAPSAFFVGFGDSSLDFEVRAFVDSMDKRLRVRHELLLAISRSLQDNGIEIPFPQRDINIRSAPGPDGVPRVGPAQ